MTGSARLNVLFLAPYCDGGDVGESFNSNRWAKALAQHVDITVLSLHRKGQRPLQEQLPDAETHTWNELPVLDRFERFNAIAKPAYVKYYLCARRWIRQALASGRSFDLIHQMTPAAARYPSAGAGFGIPLVHGPIQGSVETPEGFKDACSENSAWYMKLRNVDKSRLKHDPLLRSSYQKAALVLVGSSYMRDLLALADVQRVEELVHLNIDGLVEHPERSYRIGEPMRLLHVGRTVRTKGLLDAIRALAAIKDSASFTLDVVGDGDNLAECKTEAARLELGDLIRFHGKLPRQAVEDYYASCHALVFPSFREPAGGVVIEAMRHGLPVVTTNVGGPGYYVTDECGFRVGAINPEQMSNDLAQAIAKLINEPGLYQQLQAGAYSRAMQLGDFEGKLQWLLDRYRELVMQSSRP
jgi:glycosyltransferase involved in cell wall biosynthesis